MFSSNPGRRRSRTASVTDNSRRRRSVGRNFVRITLADRSIRPCSNPSSTSTAAGQSAWKHWPVSPRPRSAAECLVRRGSRARPRAEPEMSALRAALEQLGKLPPGLYLSINASPETILSDEFRASWRRCPAERVVLELTEHTEIDDYPLFDETITELRSTGSAWRSTTRVPDTLVSAHPQSPSRHHQARHRPHPRHRHRPGPTGPRLSPDDVRSGRLQRLHRGRGHRDRAN